MKTINYIFILSLSLFITACAEKFEIADDTNAFFYVHVEGAQLPVWIRGNTGAGKILLFIQGGPGGSAIDFAQIDYPAWKNSLEKDFAIAYYDQRGTGNMQGNFDLESISLAQYAEDIRQLLVVLKKHYPEAELYLFGHSFGGYLAMDYLQRFPDDQLVKGAINFHGPTTVDTDPERWIFRRDYLIGVAQEKLQAGLDSSLWQEVLAWTEAHPAIDGLEAFRQWNRYAEIVAIEADRPISMTDALEVVLFSPYSYFSAYNYGKLDQVEQRLYDDSKINRQLEKLDRIKKPILLLTGRFDDIAPPEEMQAVLDRISSSQKSLFVIPEAGHESFLDQPEVFNKQIKDFVKP